MEIGGPGTFQQSNNETIKHEDMCNQVKMTTDMTFIIQSSGSAACKAMSWKEEDTIKVVSDSK